MPGDGDTPLYPRSPPARQRRGDTARTAPPRLPRSPCARPMSPRRTFWRVSCRRIHQHAAPRLPARRGV